MEEFGDWGIINAILLFLFRLSSNCALSSSPWLPSLIPESILAPRKQVLIVIIVELKVKCTFFRARIMLSKSDKMNRDYRIRCIR